MGSGQVRTRMWLLLCQVAVLSRQTMTLRRDITWISGGTNCLFTVYDHDTCVYQWRVIWLLLCQVAVLSHQTMTWRRDITWISGGTNCWRKSTRLVWNSVENWFYSLRSSPWLNSSLIKCQFVHCFIVLGCIHTDMSMSTVKLLLNAGSLINAGVLRPLF